MRLRDPVAQDRTGIDAADLGHVQVKQHYVWAGSDCQLDGLAAIPRERHDLDLFVRFKQGSGTFAHQPVIVGYEHTDRFTSLYDCLLPPSIRSVGWAAVERPRIVDEHSHAVTAVARVARALVGMGGLHELGGDALGEISEALGLDVVAMYTPDPNGSTVLALFQVWPEDGEDGRVAEFLPLTPEAWRFLETSAGPLVLQERDALILENPFRPSAHSWVALPLLVQDRIVGAVFGSSAAPISLGPLARATLGSIADVLSAGVATTALRLEVQRTELQRERMELVAELHDGLAQDLALAVREIAFLDSNPSPDAARASTKRLGEAVRAAHKVVRAVLVDLAANIPEPGLGAAIEATIERFRRRGLRVRLDAPVPITAADATIIAVLLRVLNESLANAERHSGVGSASIVVSVENGELRLRVIDEGAGFDPHTLSAPGDGHFGITIMRARAESVGGTLLVRGSPGIGTSVDLRLPLEDRRP